MKQISFILNFDEIISKKSLPKHIQQKVENTKVLCEKCMKMVTLQAKPYLTNSRKVNTEPTDDTGKPKIEMLLKFPVLYT